MNHCVLLSGGNNGFVPTDCSCRNTAADARVEVPLLTAELTTIKGSLFEQTWSRPECGFARFACCCEVCLSN